MLLNPLILLNFTALGLGVEVSVTKEGRGPTLVFILDIKFSYIWDAGTLTFEWGGK